MSVNALYYHYRYASDGDEERVRTSCALSILSPPLLVLSVVSSTETDVIQMEVPLIMTVWRVGE